MLAERNLPGARRLWNDYVSECPREAKLVVDDVTADRARAGQARRDVDALLLKYEVEPVITKSAGLRAGVREQAVRQAQADLQYWDPEVRERAWATLRALG